MIHNFYTFLTYYPVEYVFSITFLKICTCTSSYTNGPTRGAEVFTNFIVLQYSQWPIQLASNYESKLVVLSFSFSGKQGKNCACT